MSKMSINTQGSKGQALGEYLSQVDDWAESQRRAAGVVRLGMDDVYREKYNEAQRYPDDGPFPFLEAEAEERGVDVGELAKQVLEARARWQEASVRIERQRIMAKKQVREAVSVADMARIVASLPQP